MVPSGYYIQDGCFNCAHCHQHYEEFSCNYGHEIPEAPAMSMYSSSSEYMEEERAYLMLLHKLSVHPAGLCYKFTHRKCHICGAKISYGSKHSEICSASNL